MSEFNKELRKFTVITIIVLLLITFVVSGIIVAFKADYNITGVEQAKVGKMIYEKSE